MCTVTGDVSLQVGLETITLSRGDHFETRGAANGERLEDRRADFLEPRAYHYLDLYRYK